MNTEGPTLGERLLKESAREQQRRDELISDLEDWALECAAYAVESHEYYTQKSWKDPDVWENDDEDLENCNLPENLKRAIQKLS